MAGVAIAHSFYFSYRDFFRDDLVRCPPVAVVTPPCAIPPPSHRPSRTPWVHLQSHVHSGKASTVGVALLDMMPVDLATSGVSHMKDLFGPRHSRRNVVTAPEGDGGGSAATASAPVTGTAHPTIVANPMTSVAVSHGGDAPSDAAFARAGSARLPSGSSGELLSPSGGTEVGVAGPVLQALHAHTAAIARQATTDAMPIVVSTGSSGGAGSGTGTTTKAVRPLPPGAPPASAAAEWK